MRIVSLDPPGVDRSNTRAACEQTGRGTFAGEIRPGSGGGTRLVRVEGMRTLVGVVFVLAVVAAGVGATIWSGVYDVSARRSHLAPVQWALETARDRSIAAHSRNVAVPPLDHPDMIKTGFEEFHE